MDFPLTRRRRGTRVRKAPCPHTPAAFTSDDELLNASIQLFVARQALVEAEQTPDFPREALRAARDEGRAWTRYWHASFRLGKANSALGRLCRSHRLNRTECEMLVALVLGQLSLLEQAAGHFASVDDRWTVVVNAHHRGYHHRSVNCLLNSSAAGRVPGASPTATLDSSNLPKEGR